MNKIICTILTLAAAVAASTASAGEDFYLGAGIGTKGHMNIVTSEGRFGNTNDPRPLSVFGGYQLTERFALEAGYKNFGNYKFGGRGEVDLDSIYLAGKGSIELSDNWTVFGKLGAVRHSVEVSPTGVASRETATVKPMYGVGFGYRLTPKLTLEAEVVDYRETHTQNLKLSYREAQLGLNYRF